MKRALFAVSVSILFACAVLPGCGGGGGGLLPGKTSVYRAYVANNSTRTVAAFTIDRSSGALTSTGTTTVGSGPSWVATDSQGRFAFVLTGSGTVAGYTIDARTGALASAGTATISDSAVSASIDPAARFLYVPNWMSNDVSIFTINAASGALARTDCGGGAGCNGMNFATGLSPYSNVAFDPTGKYAYLAIQGDNKVARFVIDQTTGALSSSVTVTAGTAPGYVVLDPHGKFAFAANATSNDVSAYTVSAVDGTLSQIDCGGGAGCNGKNFSTGAYPNTLAMDPAGKFLYAANANSNTVSAYTINGATGVLSEVVGSPYSVGPDAWGDQSVAVDPSGKFVYATSDQSNNVAGFSINAATGQLTPLTASPFVAGGQAYFITTTVTSY